jgi:UPF0271 protein
VASRAVAIVTRHLVESASGRRIPVAARSVCVHGDTPGAVTIARAVRAALEDAGVRLAAFA